MNHQLIRQERHRNTMTVAELEKRMHDWLAAGEYTAVIFERDSAPMAHLLYRTEPEGGIYIRQFFVVPEHRRQGVGKAAIDLFFREIVPSAPQITVEVLSHNEIGHQFWRASGFRDYSIKLERFGTT
jgi:ribosomal protein S18 acetylase RimI-like enzyme